jgi:hypothetical protein
MISKLLESSALPATIIVLGPSSAYIAACAAVWLLWPASSFWPNLAWVSITGA